MQSIQALVDRDKGGWDRLCYDVAAEQFGEHEAGRLARGLALAQQGAVTLEPIEDAAIIGTVRSGKTLYEITCDLTCSCKDFHPAQAQACKHILAFLITREVARRLSPPSEAVDPYCLLESEHEEGLLLDLDDDVPELAGELAPEPDPETPSEEESPPAQLFQADTPQEDPRPTVNIDNPAGFNFKAKVGSMELWYTFHDVNDVALMTRLRLILPQLQEMVEACEERQQARKPQAPIQGTGTFPAGGKNGTPPINGNDTDRSWCPHHSVHMEWHPENERGPGWYSHRLGSGGYCRGGN